MDLATGAMSSLLPKLAELLKQEYKLQKGVTKQIKSLKDELEIVHAFLLKVAEVPHDKLDEHVRIWARDVRKASYEMEDIIDTFLIVQDEAAAKPSGLKRLTEKMAKLFDFKKLMDRRSIAGKIDEIMNQLQIVADRRARYKFDDIVANPARTRSTLDDPRLLDLYGMKKHFGIDEPLEKLTEMLSEEKDCDGVSEKEMKIVSIVGYGGLGKTTIAKAVYDKLKAKFHCAAFVPVGQNPNMKKVFRDILIDFGKEDSNLMILDERQLVQKIVEFLKDKRYFIVIDDIWELSTWGYIKRALVDNNLGNAIITTTHKFQVGKGTGLVYKLKVLSEDHCRKLFFTKIFGKEECPDRYKSAYDQVVEVLNKF